PTAGEKLFQSLLYHLVFGFGEFLPVNSSFVTDPLVAYGFHRALRSVPEMPNNPLLPPIGNACKPLFSQGTPQKSYRRPRLSVRSGRTFQPPLKKAPHSF